MAASPQLKVFDAQGRYCAACHYFEDAAMLVGGHGDGAVIKWGHGAVIWREGLEAISASDSFDEARITMEERIAELHRKGHERIYGRAIA